MTWLLPIVEGDGDVKAIPVLVRRLLHEVHHRFDVQLLPAQKRGEWPKVKQEFERFYRSARLEQAPILWVLDFDCEHCLDQEKEVQWAVKEAERIDSTGSMELVFLVKEFESIFLWQKKCLNDFYPELKGNLVLPENPEEVRDAKGWISRSLPKGRCYKPMADQARIAARLPLEELRAVSPSFQRLEQAVLRLI